MIETMHKTSQLVHVRIWLVTSPKNLLCNPGHRVNIHHLNGRKIQRKVKRNRLKVYALPSYTAMWVSGLAITDNTKVNATCNEAMLAPGSCTHVRTAFYRITVIFFIVQLMKVVWFVTYLCLITYAGKYFQSISLDFSLNRSTI